MDCAAAGVSSVDARDLKGFETRLGYAFKNRELLEMALCHASRANEVAGLASNERLEFLGDSVVGLAVANLLYAAHPGWEEGALTRALHALVDKRAHATLAEDLGLGQVIELGRTARSQEAGETGRRNILANAMEAVIGAMYLDGGEPPVTELMERCFPAAFEAGTAAPRRDPKTELQEACVARFGELPRYSLVADNGIDGDNARFEMEVRVPSPDSSTAHGVGRSKRLAERIAAKSALRALPPLASGDGEEIGDG